jgi:hypothetical protein
MGARPEENEKNAFALKEGVRHDPWIYADIVVAVGQAGLNKVCEMVPRARRNPTPTTWFLLAKNK